uniref:GST C-terminal domain-containing protein n=1 Tax=Paulinella chromatophora TaxID=39717 RepID=A1XYT7_PAUCH|nr:hypothetical protein PCC_0684 [Paulinella chromatophora]ABH09257.1 hypothetical protein [Paulinella chromatophora]ACB43102.1 hypothetical protein PCC_0684 [Paulinella chromatophora]|eukprot:gb/GEZN01008237.1/.p1 GENE.gb/GEZN01008237.1/~~gb/GEZN01008237.1/.p1  ORF type:complete len:324 (+),score=-20.53 gb/GEZN01008237.1/:107-1078(+)
MTIPPYIVNSVRQACRWQWKQLMTGLGPADAYGNYCRPKSNFILVPELPKESAEVHQFVLIVGRSCPWAHRTWLVWSLRKLKEKIKLIIVVPDRKQGRWRFETPFQGLKSVSDLYKQCGAPPHQRATVPLLIDQKKMTILCNESSQLVELLSNWPASSDSPELMPFRHHTSIDQWANILQYSVNDGVYRCGFARQQTAYNHAEEGLFSTLQKLEKTLRKGGPWICGNQLTLADVLLFPTLIRWEIVYAPLFGCSRQFLWQFPAIWNWRQRLFSLPGVAESCDGQAIVSDYFGSLFPLNPSGIIPASPCLTRLVLNPILRINYD